MSCSLHKARQDAKASMEKLYLKSKQAEPFSIKYIWQISHGILFWNHSDGCWDFNKKRIPTSNFNHFCQQDWKAELYKNDIHNPYYPEKKSTIRFVTLLSTFFGSHWIGVIITIGMGTITDQVLRLILRGLNSRSTGPRSLNHEDSERAEPIFMCISVTHSSLILHMF